MSYEMTPQAKRVYDALRSIGLTNRGYHRSFSVRTEKHRYRDEETGIRFSEWGEAHAVLTTIAANELVAEKARHLECAFQVSVEVLETATGGHYCFVHSGLHRTW